MAPLQLSSFSAVGGQSRYPKVFSKKFENSSFLSTFCGRDLCLINGGSVEVTFLKKRRLYRLVFNVYAMSPSSNSTFKMDLNEYMITLEKPLGIRFALSIDGKVFVHSLKKGGNTEKSRIILIGDTLKKTSESVGERLVEIKDFDDTEKMMKEKSGQWSLVLERPFAPFLIHQLHLMSELDMLFNRGRVPITTWNKIILASNLRSSSEDSGNLGFVTFSSKFLTAKGWSFLINHNGQATMRQPQKNARGDQVNYFLRGRIRR